MTHIVDRLGALQAQIATLEAEAKKIKQTLIAKGAGAYEGELFRAVVSVSERNTLDMDAVRAKLSPQFIAAHTKTTEVATVRTNAKIDGIVTAITKVKAAA